MQLTYCMTSSMEEKGIYGVLVSDVCYSGRIFRANTSNRREKFIPTDKFEFKYPSKPKSNSTKWSGNKDGNCVSIASCQPTHVAEEVTNVDGTKGGAFTLSLVRAGVALAEQNALPTSYLQILQFLSYLVDFLKVQDSHDSSCS